MVEAGELERTGEVDCFVGQFSGWVVGCVACREERQLGVFGVCSRYQLRGQLVGGGLQCVAAEQLQTAVRGITTVGLAVTREVDSVIPMELTEDRGLDKTVVLVVPGFASIATVSCTSCSTPGGAFWPGVVGILTSKR